jgi:quinol monooxygenase YgiN
MADGKVSLSVVFEAKPGREEELGNHLKALVAPTRAEAGCVEYHLNTSEDKPGLFLFYEVFADQAALDSHIAQEYFQAFVKHRETNDPVAEVTVTRWAPFA